MGKKWRCGCRIAAIDELISRHLRQSRKNLQALLFESVVVFECNATGDRSGKLTLREAHQTWHGSGIPFKNNTADWYYKARQRRIPLLFVHIEKVEIAI